MVRIVGNAQLPNAPSLVALTTANGQSCLHKAAMGDTPGHVACVRLLAGPEANQVRRQPARTLNLNSQRLSGGCGVGSQVMLMKPDHDSLNVVLLAAAHGSLPVRSYSSGQHTSAPLA